MGLKTKSCIVCGIIVLVLIILILILTIAGVIFVSRLSEQAEDDDNSSSQGRKIQEKLLGIIQSHPGLLSVFYKEYETKWDRLNFIQNNLIKPYFSKEPQKEVKFYLYDNSSDLSPSAYKEIVYGDPESMKQIVVPEKAQLKILIHGFSRNFNRSFPQRMKNAFLEHTNNPVICVDWSTMAGAPDGLFRKLSSAILYYGIVDMNIPQVGELIGKFIVDLKMTKLISNLDQVHVIGHSLGAHVAGEVGQEVQAELEGEKIGRITGLDPASPGFENKTLEYRLDESDAHFVDIIHTSYLLGDRRPTGHADFYPNSDADLQPGCEKNNKTGVSAIRHVIKTFIIGGCDHNSAIVYYTESITNRKILGCQFETESEGDGDTEEKGQFLGKCSDVCDDEVVFGEHISSAVDGEYCFTMNLPKRKRKRRHNNKYFERMWML